MRNIYIGFIVLIYGVCYSQNLIQTDIHGKKLKDLIRFEKTINSTIYKENTTHFSPESILQPVVFVRKEKDIPNLKVYYTPYKKDSSLAEILYEWDSSNFEEGERGKKPLSFNKAMVKKYLEIVTEISKKYGKSTQKGSLDNLKLLSSEDGLTREDEWSIHDSFTVSSYIVLSEYYKKEGAVTIARTHRIRVYVTDIRKDEDDQSLSEKKVNFFNQSFLSFVNTLKTSGYQGVKNLFSDRVKDMITEDMIKALIENTSFDKGVELFMSGYQVAKDGNQYPMLQYRYSAGAEPPTEIINVLFDKDGKILGINPLKKL